MGAGHAHALYRSFGFVDTMEKLGVERRLYTAGENKGFLDPFLPSKLSDVEHIKKLLGNIHEQFKTAVREGRGDRLQDVRNSTAAWYGPARKACRWDWPMNSVVPAT